MEQEAREETGMGWVISLGAGREQLPLIRAIQAEGYSCLAFDKDPNAPGKDVADQFEDISNRDVDGMLEECNGLRAFSGVMAAASEVPDVMAILAHKLGLPGIPVAAGMLLKDKRAYKNVLKAAGIPHTECIDTGYGTCRSDFDTMGRNVVVKPQQGSGSRGVSHVTNPMELDIAIRDAELVYPDVIMERYQPGPQISAEYLIRDGVAWTAAFVDRFYESFGKEVGGSVPSSWDSEWEASSDIALAAADALGISRGTIKLDLVLTEQGPKIIEMTCRLSGGALAKIVLESTGVDYLRQAVRIAAGKEPVWELMTSTGQKNVAMDLQGNRIDWDESRKYIVRELGKVAK